MKVWAHHFSAGHRAFWFRVFGYGLAVRDIRYGFGLSFSERNGHVRFFRMGPWLVKPLFPGDWLDQEARMK